MSAQHLQSQRLTRATFSSAVLCWVAVFSVIIGTQAVVAQIPNQTAPVARTARLMSASDLDTFAQLPVPKSTDQACDECPACNGKSCTDCETPNRAQPSTRVQLDGYVFDTTDGKRPCNCPDCTVERERDYALTDALSELELTDASLIENYVMPRGQFSPLSISTSQSDVFTKQMAQLLCGCLKNMKPTDPEFQASIESSMKMVARHAWIEQQNHIAGLQKLHEKDVAILQQQLTKSLAEANTARVVNGWLSSLYGNQNRAFQKMQSLATNTNSLHRTLANIDQRLRSTPNNAVAPVAKLKPISQPLTPIRQANVIEDQHHDEIKILMEQMRRIESRLNQLRRKPTVRPASHIEPIQQQGSAQPPRTVQQQSPLMPLPERMAIPRSNYPNR